MKCKKCGEINESGSVFCQECGEPLVPDDTAKKPKTEKKPKTDRSKAASPDEVFPDEGKANEKSEPEKPSAKPSEKSAAKKKGAEKQAKAKKTKQNAAKKKPADKSQKQGKAKKKPADKSLKQGKSKREGARVTIRRGRSKKQIESDKVYRSRMPFIITAFITAFLALFQFVIPMFEWVSYEYSLADFSTFSWDLSNMEMTSVSEDKLDLIDLAGRFHNNDNILKFVTGNEDFSLGDIIPDGVSSLIGGTADQIKVSNFIPESVNESFDEGRTAAIAVSYVFIVALGLYLVFIVLVLLRRRIIAAVFGITASLLYGGACLGVMYAVNMLNKTVEAKNNVKWLVEADFQTLDMPYVGLALSGVIIALCVVFVILGINTEKKVKKRKGKS